MESNFSNSAQKDAKANKLKEYENMFRILQKQRDYEKIKSLAEELKQYDPGNASAEEWLKKAEKKEKRKGFFATLFSRSKESEPKSAQELSISKTNMSQDVEQTKAGVVVDIDTPVTQPAAVPTTSLVVKNSQDSQPSPRKEFSLLGFAKLFMVFTVSFIALTGAFLYVEFLDEDNTVLGLMDIENTGSKLHLASQELTEAKNQALILEEEFNKYQNGYNSEILAQVEEVVEKRINWADVLFKIDEVTNSVYELNDFFKYIEYENYAFDGEKKTIQITGRLSDPQGNNLTKLIELEEAFMYYPKDKNNLNDPTKPFFEGFNALKTLSKTFDPQSGRYISDFQLSFDIPQSQ